MKGTGRHNALDVARPSSRANPTPRGAHAPTADPSLVPLVFLAIAAAGLLGAVIGGTNIAFVAIGLTIAVVAGSIAALAWGRSGSVSRRISTDGWWKFVLAAPCLIAAVVITSGLGGQRPTSRAARFRTAGSGVVGRW